MKHGDQHNPMNDSPKGIAEVTHILDHNPMVVHHLLTPRPGTVPGIAGMRRTTGIVHRGEALVKKRPALLMKILRSSIQFISRDFSCNHDATMSLRFALGMYVSQIFAVCFCVLRVRSSCACSAY